MLQVFVESDEEVESDPLLEVPLSDLLAQPARDHRDHKDHRVAHTSTAAADQRLHLHCQCAEQMRIRQECILLTFKRPWLW